MGTHHYDQRYYYFGFETSPEVNLNYYYCYYCCCCLRCWWSAALIFLLILANLLCICSECGTAVNFSFQVHRNGIILSEIVSHTTHRLARSCEVNGIFPFLAFVKSFVTLSVQVLNSMNNNNNYNNNNDSNGKLLKWTRRYGYHIPSLIRKNIIRM